MSAADVTSQLRSPELVAFLHGGPAVIVGSSDEQLVPAISRGFAVRLAPDRGTLDVFVGRAQSAAFLANLRPGRPIAVTICDPVNQTAVQIKGPVLGWQAPEPADVDWEEQQWQLFQAALGRTGLTAGQSAQLRCSDLVRVTLAPAAVFRQTPGPAAGSALARGATLC